jgi:hypothetical protein
MTCNPNSDIVKILAAMMESNKVEGDALDEAVIEAKSYEASGINNSGVEAQILYLIETYSVRDAEEIVRGLIMTTVPEWAQGMVAHYRREHNLPETITDRAIYEKLEALHYSP